MGRQADGWIDGRMEGKKVLTFEKRDECHQRLGPTAPCQSLVAFPVEDPCDPCRPLQSLHLDTGHTVAGTHYTQYSRGE
jgi:hypothetical protein